MGADRGRQPQNAPIYYVLTAGANHTPETKKTAGVLSAVFFLPILTWLAVPH